MSRTVLNGIVRQTRVISALTMREIRLRNSKYAFSYFLDILDTLGIVIVTAAFFYIMGRKPVIGDSIILFIATGIFPVHYFKSISLKASAGVKTAGRIKLLPQIDTLDIALARTIVEMFTFTIIFIIFFSVADMFRLSRYVIPYNFDAVIQSLIILTIFGLGVGLCNAFIARTFPIWTMIWSIIARAQIIFAGVFYIPEYMPPYLKEFIIYNPILHLVSKFRSAFYPSYPTHMIDLSYIMWWTAGAVVMGLAMDRVLRGRVSLA